MGATSRKHRAGRLVSTGLLTGTIAGIASILLSGAALAQAQTQADVTTLPPLDVTTSRAAVRGAVTARQAPAENPGTTADNAGVPTEGPAAVGNKIVGTSTSVITATDIARSPAQTLPDILAQQAGVQVQHLFGGTNGSRDSVDLRAFGAFANSNVLILVNGRRYQDFDSQGFDFSSIPLNSIERIEITRGNSGTVIYGDGAIGGVINIVTKTRPGAPLEGRSEIAVGSFNYRENRSSLGVSSGPWSATVFGNAINSDGYRRNSQLRQQNVVGSLNYANRGWAAYLNVAADQQQQGLAGGLPKSSTALPFTLATPAQSNTPLDDSTKHGFNLTTGFVMPVANGTELIVDGGVRRKFQQATFYDYFPAPAFVYNAQAAVPSNYLNTGMTTSSFTPRLDATFSLFGAQNRLLTGVDLYNTQYDSDRYQTPGGQVIHHYDIRQTTAAFYAMNKASVLPNFDVSLGGRLQRNMIKAIDIYDPNVDPNNGSFGTNPQAPPLSSAEWQYAAHAGFEHRLNSTFALFGRAARAFRLPNADERVGAGNPFGLVAPANFGMKTQTSYDFEGGVRFTWGRVNIESSVYDMYLNNEIHFIPALQQNVSLDPTRRTGWETSATYQVTNDVRLLGSLAYVRAVFREGQFAGHEIPLVSRWTGNAGVSWDIVKKLLVLDVRGRFWSNRHMDNDQADIQPRIPANGTVDVKLAGAYQRFFWSATVQNLFNVSYYDYAIASGGFPAGPFGGAIPPTIGAFSAYPQAGRTFLLRAGATF